MEEGVNPTTYPSSEFLWLDFGNVNVTVDVQWRRNGIPPTSDQNPLHLWPCNFVPGGGGGSLHIFRNSMIFNARTKLRSLCVWKAHILTQWTPWQTANVQPPVWPRAWKCGAPDNKLCSCTRINIILCELTSSTSSSSCSMGSTSFTRSWIRLRSITVLEDPAPNTGCEGVDLFDILDV